MCHPQPLQGRHLMKSSVHCVASTPKRRALPRAQSRDVTWWNVTDIASITNIYILCIYSCIHGEVKSPSYPCCILLLSFAFFIGWSNFLVRHIVKRTNVPHLVPRHLGAICWSRFSSVHQTCSSQPGQIHDRRVRTRLEMSIFIYIVEYHIYIL